MTQRGTHSPGDGIKQRRRFDRPEHFSTYAPRELVRGLKVIAAIRDVPLWLIVTDALQHYMHRYEQEHGQLPRLAFPSSGNDGKES